MLRFLFDSNTSSERSDTKSLYERFKQSEEGTSLSDLEKADDIGSALGSLQRKWDLSINSPFGKELGELFETLAGESDLFQTLQLATDSFVDDVALDTQNRARMIRKTSLNEHAEQNRDTVRATLASLGDVLLESLPESLFSDQRDEHQVFEVRLLDLMNEPVKALSHLIAVLESSQLQNTALFYSLRETLTQNQTHIETHVRKNARPEDLERDHSAEEIIALYTRNTCLEGLFELRVPFVIPQNVRFEHMHLVAGSGHGKTQTLQYIISRDLEEVAKGNMGFAVIDSQGDLINEILSRQAISDLGDRVLLIDPNDIAYPPALNMFDVGLERTQQASPVEREKIINGTIDLYSYIFSSLLGAELTQKQGVIFTYLARMMMVIPNANIHTLRELVEDGKQFEEHFDKLDPNSRYFFKEQFFTGNYRATRQQVLTRLWGVLSNSTFEKMFSARESKVDLFDAMNQGKIVLVNTAKDLLKSEGCSIFGRFFIALIAQAALSRSVIPASERKPFFVTIDEAHDYFDDKVEDIANQARKYNVGLTLSHQNLDQAGAKLRASIMSSTSLKFAGGVSAKDAQVLAQNMHAKPEDILRAKKRKNHTQFACYIRNLTPAPILIDIPFGTLESMPACSDNDRELFIQENRQRVAQVNEDVVDESDEPSINDPDVKEELTDIEPALPGKGGTEHKKTQKMIADSAIKAGFQANIEEHIGDGKHIDVVLYIGKRKIACEISVSTSVTHEIKNVEKCLSVDADQVWVISQDKGWRKKLDEELKYHQYKQVVLVIDTAEVSDEIRKLKPSGKAQTVSGRIVESSFTDSTDQQKERREIVMAKLLNGS